MNKPKDNLMTVGFHGTVEKSTKYSSHRLISLSHSDSLSCILQNSTISGAEGQDVAALTVTTLEEMRNNHAFNLFGRK